MTLTWPPLTIGTIVAAVVLIASCILFGVGQLELAPLLLVAAVCAFKL